MKKLLICAAAVVAVLAVGHEAINLVAKHELKAALASVPDANIHVRRVSHSLLAGSVKLRGIDISLPEVSGHIDAVKLERVQWGSLMKGEARVGRLITKSLVGRLPVALRTV